MDMIVANVYGGFVKGIKRLNIGLWFWKGLSIVLDMGREEYRADTVAHGELNGHLKKMVEDGWELYKMLECAALNGVDYVTVVWKNGREEDWHFSERTYSVMAEHFNSTANPANVQT